MLLVQAISMAQELCSGPKKARTRWRDVNSVRTNSFPVAIYIEVGKYSWPIVVFFIYQFS